MARRHFGAGPPFRTRPRVDFPGAVARLAANPFSGFSAGPHTPAGTGERSNPITPEDLTWAEIDLDALESNRCLFLRMIGEGVALMPVVKANAYGHGFDLVVAADVFIYFGELSSCFDAAARRCAPGAWFAFSTECSAGRDYALGQSGRYGHARSYVERIAAKSGFDVRACRRGSLRLEHGAAVTGHVFLCKLHSDC